MPAAPPQLPPAQDIMTVVPLSLPSLASLLSPNSRLATGSRPPRLLQVFAVEIAGG
jgi:hypothetical protein